MKIKSIVVFFGAFSICTCLELPNFETQVSEEVENLKMHLVDVGMEVTNFGLGQITSFIRQFKTDYIPNSNKISGDSCILFGTNLLKRVIPAKLSCLKEAAKKLTTTRAKLTKEILPCFGKCVGIKLKLLDSDGTPNLSSSQKFIDEIVPKKLIKYAFILFDKCEEEISAIEPNDLTCETHKAVSKCVSAAISEFALEAFKLCPDIPQGWKNLVETIANAVNG